MNGKRFGRPAMAMIVAGALLNSTGSRAQTVAAFAFGRGGAAARAAVDVQHRLRELVASSGSLRHVDIGELLQPGGEPQRQKALQQARELLGRGKQQYEQLELEQAVASLGMALRKFEYSYAWLEKPAELIECLVYLGATSVLVGEPDQAHRYFLRALDLPGRAVLDPNLFPPNIQEVFQQAQQEHATAKSGAVRLVSEPLGAVVFIDGRYVGGTPVDVADLRPGIHLVRALRDGYLPWGGRIKVVAKRRRILRLRLRPAAKHKEFAARLRPLIGQLARGEPPTAAASLAELLGAERLYLVWLQGSAAALALKGWAWEGEKSGTVEAVADSQSPSYQEQVTEFLKRLLQARPEAVAGTTAGGEEMALGLDLSSGEAPAGGGEESPAGTAESAATPPGEAPGPPAASEPVEEAIAGAGGVAVTGGAEKVVAETAATAPGKKDDQVAASWWPDDWYKKWWFWTAVGVVVAGAGVGTYFGVTAGSSGGGLVLDLH